MIQSIKYYEPNWTDGMKISEKHLFEQDNFMIDALRDAVSLRLNAFNYGLLPMDTSAKENSIFDLNRTATGDVQLVIKHCSAVTPAGCRIDLSNYTTNIKSLINTAGKEDKEISGDYYILISVNAFEQTPFGNIDQEETPPRNAFVQPKYYISVLPASELSREHIGGNYLLIGKVSLVNDTAEIDRLFIPPCASVYSHSSLITYYESFAKSIGGLQYLALKIIGKAANAQQNTALARNIKSFCSAYINYSSSVYFYFRNMVRGLPPVYMVEVFSRMALCLYNNVHSLMPAEVEEMLNYSFEWSEIAPRTLLNQLSGVSEIVYDHNDCGKYLADIQNLIKSLETILGKLSELDYLGQHKENVIVNEQNITPASKNQKGWSVLD